MTRRLLVNADDLGSDPAGIAPIVRTLREGIVRRVSLLANGAAIEQAAPALPPATAVSLHLNLSEGRPLSGPVPGLSGPDGAFPGRDEARRRLESGGVAQEPLEREVRAQYDRLASLGLRIDRIDGHQHLHLLQAVREACRSTLRGAIRLVRIPEEAAPPPARMAWAPEAFARTCREARLDFASWGCIAPPSFRWFDWSGTPTLDRLESLLRALPKGDVELMVHPGAGNGPPGSFDGEDRRRETEALCDPRLPGRLAALRIVLWDGREAL